MTQSRELNQLIVYTCNLFKLLVLRGDSGGFLSLDTEW